MTMHEHGTECGCQPTASILVDADGNNRTADVLASVQKHVCGPYCYHNSIGYKQAQARRQRRATYEKVWNAQLGRVRPPYSKEVTVPLHLVGVLPLIVPPDAPTPSPEQIKAAQKEHRRRRNARRRRR